MVKNQKGITLIALIITIIVMLILVGVTINVALNGGLFTKAEDAAIGTEKQAMYEQIVSNMELTNDGKISVKGTFDKVVAEFGADKVTNINPATVDANTTEVTFSVVGKTGTYNYKISAKSIEKDPVQSPGGVQPPLQTGGLVYGKVYEGEIGAICFSEKYNRFTGSTDITVWNTYSYDKESGSLNMAGMMEGNVSEDGKSISVNIGGTNYVWNITETELFKQYNPKLLSELGFDEILGVNCYTGMYYNSDVDKLISIFESGDSGLINIWIEEMNTTYGGFFSSEVTVVDTTHIQRNGITYTLIETLE